MKETEIKNLIYEAVLKIQPNFGNEIHLTVPQLQFGDFSSNIALILAKTLKRNPMEVGEAIKSKIENHEAIESIQVLQPGFINCWLSKQTLISPLEQAVKNKFDIKPFWYGKEKKVMVEFAHPNTHKLFHIGHLRNIATGESVARMLATVGNTVVRTNYQGDVGLHIAKCLWGVKQMMKKNMNDIFDTLSLTEKNQLIGKAYSEGQTAYESSEDAKKEIISSAQPLS